MLLLFVFWSAYNRIKLDRLRCTTNYMISFSLKLERFINMNLKIAISIFRKTFCYRMWTWTGGSCAGRSMANATIVTTSVTSPWKLERKSRYNNCLILFIGNPYRYNSLTSLYSTKLCPNFGMYYRFKVMVV